MDKSKEYAEKIELFSHEMHNFAEYIKNNPDKVEYSEIQDMYLELLPFEIELLSSISSKFPKLFDYMLKDEKND